MARNQAEAHVGIMADMMGSHFATTQDMKDLRVELTQDMEKLRTDLRQDMAQLRSDLMQEIYQVNQDLVTIHNKMDNLEYRLTIKLGGLLAGSIALAATVMTLIIKLV